VESLRKKETKRNNICGVSCQDPDGLCTASGLKQYAYA